MNFEKIVKAVLNKLFSTLSIEDIIALLGGQQKILDVFMKISDNLTDKQREEFRKKFFGEIKLECDCCELFKERYED